MEQQQKNSDFGEEQLVDLMIESGFCAKEINYLQKIALKENDSLLQLINKFACSFYFKIRLTIMTAFTFFIFIYLTENVGGYVVFRFIIFFMPIIYYFTAKPILAYKSYRFMHRHWLLLISAKRNLLKHPYGYIDYDEEPLVNLMIKSGFRIKKIRSMQQTALQARTLLLQEIERLCGRYYSNIYSLLMLALVLIVTYFFFSNKTEVNITVFIITLFFWVMFKFISYPLLSYKVYRFMHQHRLFLLHAKEQWIKQQEKYFNPNGEKFTALLITNFFRKKELEHLQQIAIRGRTTILQEIKMLYLNYYPTMRGVIIIFLGMTPLFYCVETIVGYSVVFITICFVLLTYHLFCQPILCYKSYHFILKYQFVINLKENLMGVQKDNINAEEEQLIDMMKKNGFLVKEIMFARQMAICKQTSLLQEIDKFGRLFYPMTRGIIIVFLLCIVPYFYFAETAESYIVAFLILCMVWIGFNFTYRPILYYKAYRFMRNYRLKNS